MKIFKKILLVLSGLGALVIVLCLLRIWLIGGTKPDDILSAVDLELPNYTIVSPTDNLERGASRFDVFEYELSFSKNDTADVLKQLESEEWERSGKEYVKSVDVDDDLSYGASVDLSEGKVYLNVMVDEEYHIIEVVIIFLVLVSGIALWIIYVIAWLAACQRRNVVR